MKHLTLSSLIGKEIENIRFQYLPENEYGLQSFHSFVKFTDGCVIDMPKFDEEDFLEWNKINIDYLTSAYENGKTPDESLTSVIIGQVIEGIYFCYYNDAIDTDYPAMLLLSNRFFLTERNFGPAGVNNIGLIILNEEQFAGEIKRLAGVGVIVKKYNAAS